MTPRRRFLLAGAGAAALVAGHRVLPDLLSARDFDFRAMEGMPGFRRLAAGRTSPANLDPLVGIGDRERVPGAALAAIRADPCVALFFDGAGDAEAVPVAFVSDHYCPYCRVLWSELERMRSEGSIALTVHEWPLFGENSNRAARAALAARAQHAGAAMHARLMRTRFLATPGYLAELSADLGISAAALERDMESRPVDAALRDARAVASVFHLTGTPALVVGRTLVVGEITPARLEALVGIERRADRVC